MEIDVQASMSIQTASNIKVELTDQTLPHPCDLVTGGTAEGAKVLFPIAIHACAVTPLNGPHLVSMSGSAPFWVQSLKEHFFGIEVKLPLERAFYMKDLHGQMVHLKTSASF
jgi:hypothetical protein